MNLSKLTLLTLTSVYLVQPTFAGGVIGLGPAPDLELAPVGPVGPIDDTWINIDPEGEITRFIIHSNTSITAFVIPDSQIFLPPDRPFEGIGIECISTECDLGPTDFIYYKNSTTEETLLTAEARWTQSESDISSSTNDDVILSEKRVAFCQNNNYTTINARLSHRVDPDFATQNSYTS